MSSISERMLKLQSRVEWERKNKRAWVRKRLPSTKVRVKGPDGKRISVSKQYCELLRGPCPFTNLLECRCELAPYHVQLAIRALRAKRLKEREQTA